MTRVYVPATIEILQRLVADREFDPMSRTAFAVTPTLREAYSSGDDEELAEVAMAEAARASLRLIAGRVGESGSDGVRFRRAVVAADVDDVTPRPDLDDAVVRLPGPVTIGTVASVHVDLAEAEPDIERAVSAIDEADLGDPDAEFVLGDAEDHVLAWYATQELPFLLELL
ncbi:MULTISPECIES: hypothetical protein [Rhodococcus]|jgi:hypothetical protein|uniref:Uncharacterized protein n=2 Tax=Rhodococcus TaxID=1827 RepID=A0AB38FAN6_RHOWR|nr:MULTISPECIES: hypothetical protein [Rhodococcus]KXF56362.1 hypothetical protein AXA44_03830 [Rhodococcus sp. SC4]RZK84690.1 MAG: hypothetical protein EOP26_07680 [Rhodococcus sp. (in: high G+C Gram-positive bacteria)]AII04701.1 hypothetical protein EP51_08850 [Rhodococcus opacus]EJI94539.1 hypothetical protein JVH1_7994 [Rhodococcus sp. JVH1]KXX58473.1 hypothetical protein AZG88_45570 [Rhodococcus sp. LB1]